MRKPFLDIHVGNGMPTFGSFGLETQTSKPNIKIWLSAPARTQVAMCVVFVWIHLAFKVWCPRSKPGKTAQGKV